MHNAILKKKCPIEIGPGGPQLNRYISDPNKNFGKPFSLKIRHTKALEYFRAI